MSVIKEVLRNIISRPVTLKYPQERKELPERFRGRITIDYDNCIGCGLCARVCPALAITMVNPPGKKDIRSRRPLVHLYKCIFCGQCALVCPRKVISFTHKYELASYDKEGPVVAPPFVKKGNKGGRELSKG